MDFYEAIKQRRTIRDLQDKAIPTDVIHRILHAALMAPTNDHMRNWEFVVITDPEEKAKIIHKIPKTYSRNNIESFLDNYNLNDPCQRDMYMDGVPKQYSMLYHSGCLVLPYFRQDSPLLKPKSLNDLNAFASIWCCIENILLAATAEGLAASFRIPFPNEVNYLKETIGYPENYVMPCYIAIGYPTESAVINVQHEYNVEDKIHINRW